MSKEETHDTNILMNTRWASLLDQIRQLPIDSWESKLVDGFISQVHNLAARRRQTREAVREKLQRVLDQLRNDHKDDLAFFNIDRHPLPDWRATFCPIDKVRERTKTVEDLLLQLATFHSLNQQAPHNIQESRQLRIDKEAVENRICAFVEQLVREFSRTVDDSQSLGDTVIVEDEDPPPDPSDPPPRNERTAPLRGDEERLPPISTVPSNEESHPEPSRIRDQVEAESLPMPDENGRISHDRLPSATVFPNKTPPPLRTAYDVAVLLQTHESKDNWISLGWSLLGEGDWAGAYWLFRSMKTAGHDVPVDPVMLAVLQGSRWLQDDSDPLVFDILRIGSELKTNGVTSDRAIRLAAALRPSMIAPLTGLVDWLPERDEISPALGTLAHAIRDFSVAGHPLRPEDLEHVEGMATHEKAITETRRHARQFLTTNQSRILKIKRATNVLHNLLGREGDLRRLLTPIIHNQATQIGEVEKVLNGFSDRQQIVDNINKIDRTQTRRPKPLAGIPREQLVRSIQEAVALANRWRSLIRLRETATSSSGDWWSGRVNILRRRVESILPDIKTELIQMQQQDRPEEEASVSLVLQRAIRQVAGFLCLRDRHDIDDIEVWMKGERTSLEDALHRRLLWMPEILVDDNGRPKDVYTREPDHAMNIAKALAHSLVKQRSLHMALAQRIDSQDFRFTNILLDAFEDNAPRQHLEEIHDDNLKGSREVLRHRVEKVQSSIEQAMVDGLLDEEERTSFSAGLESTNTREPLYFSPLFSQLDDIEDRINRKREERLDDLTEQWTELQRELGLRIQPEQLVSVGNFMQQAFDQHDTRVVEESLARLREFVHGNSEWKTEWFSPRTKQDIFTEFLEAYQSTESGLHNLRNIRQLADIVGQRETWEGYTYGTLPAKRREEVVRAFISWHRLKRLQKQHLANCRRIRVIIEYLGFHLPRGESAVIVKDHGQDWLHCEITASASDLARPIPQLGSQTNGRYNVVCLWDRPGAGAIGARLRDLKLDTDTVIVFFLGRLSEQRRRNIARQARQRELALVVLDEILLVFLARCDDTRLPTFLRCSLPYAALNPYTPFRAGNVPPEMYYGRTKMVRQLQTDDNCIVFGGRQLGKSALLRQVEREFHQPDRDQFAWVEDIKLVGDPNTGEQPDQLWIKLRDTFKEHKLFRKSIVARTSKKISDAYTECYGAIPPTPGAGSVRRGRPLSRR